MPFRPLARLAPPAALCLLIVAGCQRGPAVEVAGIPGEGGTLGAAAFDSLGLQVTLPDADSAAFALDGRPVAVEPVGDDAYRTFRLRVDSLADGAHTLAVTAGGETREWAFSVDRTPPVIRLDTVEAKGPRGPFVVRGTAAGATALAARVARADTVSVERTGDAFTLTVPAGRRLVLRARDDAGNVATRSVALAAGPMRGVHVTAAGWNARALREPILRLVREGRVNTIQLDVKDEAGHVGYRTAVPLARRIGAVKDAYDARAVLDSLHALGVRVVARLTVFRDPVLGRWAWETGRRDWLVQTAAGQPFGGSYGAYAFTNPFADSVVAYNAALAEEAARLGFDDVLLDYIRRPEGAPASMRFPGKPEADSVAGGIVRFVCQTRPRVHAHGAGFGVSVFGIAADRAWAVAQPIPALARCVDVVAPMVYPSHWGRGEYGVANPNAMPYEIVRKSVEAFHQQVAGTDAVVVPWLQDFSLGVTYGPDRVRDQIRASADAGSPAFLLWNAGARYTRDALDAK